MRERRDVANRDEDDWSLERAVDHLIRLAIPDRPFLPSLAGRVVDRLGARPAPEAPEQWHGGDLPPCVSEVVRAALVVGTAHHVRASPPRVLRSPADVAALVAPELCGLDHERVLVVVCDARNAVRRVVTVSQGGDDRAALCVREILRAVLVHSGRAFAIAHNHPSGDPTPSDADVRATRAVRAGASAVGLRFLDHVVVAGDAWASADCG